MALLTFSLVEGVLSQSNKPYFSIGIIPSSLLDPITPSIGFSLEGKIYNRFHIESVYGFDPNFNFNLISWHPNPEYRHHEYKVCFKYILSYSQQSKNKAYLGIEHFGLINDYEKMDDIFRENNVLYTFESAEVKRRVKGARGKLGFQFQLSEKFVFDIHWGIGIRNVSISYNTLNQMPLQLVLVEEFVTPIDRNAGVRNKFDFMKGIKLAYTIF